MRRDDDEKFRGFTVNLDDSVGTWILCGGRCRNLRRNYSEYQCNYRTTKTHNRCMERVSKRVSWYPLAI